MRLPPPAILPAPAATTRENPIQQPHGPHGRHTGPTGVRLPACRIYILLLLTEQVVPVKMSPILHTNQQQHPNIICQTSDLKHHRGKHRIVRKDMSKYRGDERED